VGGCRDPEERESRPRDAKRRFSASSKTGGCRYFLQGPRSKNPEKLGPGMKDYRNGYFANGLAYWQFPTEKEGDQKKGKGARGIKQPRAPVCHLAMREKVPVQPIAWPRMKNVGPNSPRKRKKDLVFSLSWASMCSKKGGGQNSSKTSGGKSKGNKHERTR